MALFTSLSSPSLLVRPVTHSRIVSAGVWILRGSAHDPDHLAGATHLLEHLTLRRCGAHDRASLAVLVDRLGGEVEAWTSPEMMGVTAQTTMDGLDDLLGLLVDAVMTPTFDRSDVELERRITLAELELVRDDPAEQAEESLLTAAWGDHSLARPVIGSATTLRRLGPRALRRHHQQLVRTGLVLAAVVGDVDPEHVAGCLRRLPLAAALERPKLLPLAWQGRDITVARRGADQVHARLGFPALAADDPRVPALTVLNRILGVGVSSRLFQRLREEEGLTYDIWSGLALRSVGGLLEVGWACTPEVHPQVLGLVREEIERLPTDITGDEVEVGRQAQLRCLQMDADSSAGLCSMDVAEMIDLGRRFDLDQSINDLEQVSLAEVRDLATQVLRLETVASAACGPEGMAVQVA